MTSRNEDLAAEFEKQIWRLVRDETSLRTFQEWVYDHLAIEDVVDKDLFLELLESDYADEGAVLDLLNRWMRGRCPGLVSLRTQRRAIRCARGILDGSADVFAASWDLFTLPWEEVIPGTRDHDEDFVALAEIGMLGAIHRDEYLRDEYLYARDDEERKEYEDWARRTAGEACRRLLRRLGCPLDVAGD